jgi:hypothetical protein
MLDACLLCGGYERTNVFGLEFRGLGGECVDEETSAVFDGCFDCRKVVEVAFDQFCAGGGKGLAFWCTRVANEGFDFVASFEQ